MPNRSVSARFLAVPENRAAILALQNVLVGLTAHDTDALPNPLYLHGPPGVGKTFLVQTLADELHLNRIEVCQRSANDFADPGNDELRDAALLIVEDLQHLPARCANRVLQLLDERLQCAAPTIFTATVGPGRLKPRGHALPGRLTSRLAAGLVVGIDPLKTPSRRKLLQALAAGARVSIAADVLDWLAEQLTRGGRQIEGAVRQIKTLQRLQARPLCIEDLREHFRSQTPTVQRIAEHVSEFYQVKPKQVLSARRSRTVLLPRQVSMYLARQLTDLSLEKIGKYFGGRDHKTVQHACKKVGALLKSDAKLSGVVRQMHAALA